MSTKEATLNNSTKILEKLQKIGNYGSGIKIAVVDGAIDHTHPLLQHLNIADTNKSKATSHGTAVCSLIAGQGVGLAPKAEIVSFPVFHENAQGQIQGCSELSIAKAIKQAHQAKCDIINISGASLSPNGLGTQELRQAVQACQDDGILIISAVGNEGKNSESVPAALEGVLAIGACDENGKPSSFNNYGTKLCKKMLLASGEEIPVATPKSTLAAVTGSSFATPIVSAICALVYNALNLPKQTLETPKTLQTLLFETATPVATVSRLNISALLKRVQQELPIKHTHQRSNTMSDIESEIDHATEVAPIVPDDIGEAVMELQAEPQAVTVNTDNQMQPAQTSLSFPQINDPASNNHVHAQATEVSPQLIQTDPRSVRAAEKIFIIGSIGYDFGSEARMDYFSQELEAFNARTGSSLNEHVPSDMAEYFKYIDSNGIKTNNEKSLGLIWTLKIDGIPVYAIEPDNQAAILAYGELVEFLEDQHREKHDPSKIERVSIAGIITGETRLLNGHVVPKISPILRGMFSWSTNALAEHVWDQQGILPQQQKFSKELLEYQQNLYTDLFKGQQHLLFQASELSKLPNYEELLEIIRTQQLEHVAMFKEYQVQQLRYLRLKQEKPDSTLSYAADYKYKGVDKFEERESELVSLINKQKGKLSNFEDEQQKKLLTDSCQLAQKTLIKQCNKFKSTTLEYSGIGKEKRKEEDKEALLLSFSKLLERIYYELRNKGVSAQERAINYAATNTTNIMEMLQDAEKEHLFLNKISVEESPICRPESECWDVVFEFFDPRKRLETSRKLYRSTIDVSDLIPVTIGELRNWYAY